MLYINSQELLRPYGSNGNAALIKPIAMSKPPQMKMGALVLVSATVAITADKIPMTRLQATATPFPVARCALGSTSGV